MKLTDYLRPEYIETGIAEQTKEALIDRMIRIAARNPKMQNIEEVRTAILEREKILSTGVGNSWAVPHAKTNAVDSLILAFGVTAEPVDFHSLDGNPVRLILLMVRRECETRLGLSLLSRASKILNSETVRNALLQAKNRKEVYDILSAEAHVFEESLAR